MKRVVQVAGHKVGDLCVVRLNSGVEVLATVTAIINTVSGVKVTLEFVNNVITVRPDQIVRRG